MIGRIHDDKMVVIADKKAGVGSRIQKKEGGARRWEY